MLRKYKIYDINANRKCAQKYTFILGKIHEDRRWGEFKGQCEETSVTHIYKQCGAPNKLDGKWGEACPFKAQIEGPHHHDLRYLRLLLN